MAIPKGQRNNFETLKKAFASGDVALMEVRDSKTGDIVDAVCAVQRVGDEYVLAPFAIMVRENPYDRFAPPDPKAPGEFTDVVGTH
jgi:hypothetical protein